jgi:hypothetical protein
VAQPSNGCEDKMKRTKFSDIALRALRLTPAAGEGEGTF